MNVPAPLELRVLRSSQTDAEQLDDELRSLFTASLNRCLGLLDSARLTGYYRELVLVLESVIFGLTVGRGRPSPGMSLLNLKYRDERRSSANGNEGPPLTKRQRTLLYLGHIVTPYVWSKVCASLARCLDAGGFPHATDLGIARLTARFPAVPPVAGDQKYAHERDPVAGPLRSMMLAWRLALWSLASRLETAMKTFEAAWRGLELVNYAVFVRRGAYRGVLERLLGTRLVYADVRASRHINFDYLNRQLIWSEVSDFILFVLPLVHMGPVGRLVNTYLPMNESIKGSSTPVPDASCPVCETTKECPIRCQAMPCRHTYCYYCFASRFGCSVEPRCYVCSEPVRHVCFV